MLFILEKLGINLCCTILGPSGPGRGGYDPSLARPRLSSDTSWERSERRSDSGNWRAGGAGGEDDDGWRISGQRSSDRTDKWRGTILFSYIIVTIFRRPSASLGVYRVMMMIVITQ